MTPRHLIPIEPAELVHRLCDDLALDLPNKHSILWLELVAFRDTRTPHDARRLANALLHIAKRPDLAAKVEELLEAEPKAGILADLKDGERAP